VLAFVQSYFLFAADDVSNTLDDDPMLAPVRMALQAQTLARFNFEHLDLKTGLLFQHFISSPGSFVRLSHSDCSLQWPAHRARVAGETPAPLEISEPHVLFGRALFALNASVCR